MVPLAAPTPRALELVTHPSEHDRLADALRDSGDVFDRVY